MIARSLRELYDQTIAADLKAEARLAAHLIGKLGKIESSGLLDPEIKQLGKLTHTRITVILADGRVIADSGAEPSSSSLCATRIWT